MSKHTPGPWSYERGTRDVIATRSRDITESIVAQLYKINPNIEYDARLIGAAPELLTAAKNAITAIEQAMKYKRWRLLDEAICALQEVVAKTEGVDNE